MDVLTAWRVQSGITLTGAGPAGLNVGPVQWAGRTSRMLDAIAAYGQGWVVENRHGLPHYINHAAAAATTTAPALSVAHPAERRRHRHQLGRRKLWRDL